MAGISVPTKDQFFKDLKEVYPDGDLDMSYNKLLWYLNNEYMPDGSHVTYPLVLRKFTEHHKKWRFQHGHNEGTRWMKDTVLNQRKTFMEFLDLEMYKQEFTIQLGTPEREKYLFGTLPKDELWRQLNNFKKIWKNRSEEK